MDKPAFQNEIVLVFTACRPLKKFPVFSAVPFRGMPHTDEFLMNFEAGD